MFIKDIIKNIKGVRNELCGLSSVNGMANVILWT